LRQAFLLSILTRGAKPEAAWKLFVLTPRMLLAPTEAKGEGGKETFLDRARRFQAGEWEALLAEAASSWKHTDAKALDEEAAQAKRLEEAEAKVRLREVRRARVHLTSAGLAPGTEETLRELTDETLRPKELSEDLPENAVNFRPRTPLKVKEKELLNPLRTAGRGSAADLAGARYENYRVLMADADAWSLFANVAQHFARADVPPPSSAASRSHDGVQERQRPC
jgi:hypothetical protein